MAAVPNRLLLAATGLLLSGCALLPPGFEQEVARQQEFAVPSEPPAAPLPDETPVGWQDLVRVAWERNGMVAAAYHEWQAALARVRVAASYPNTNVHLGVDYRVGSGGDAAARTGISLGNDPMTNLALPVKVSAAAKAQLAEARAAGERYRARRLAVQEEVLRQYFAWAGKERLRQLEEERLHWLDLALASTRARYAAAREVRQAELARAESERAAAEDRARRYQAEAAAIQHELNALVGRSPSAPLAQPPALPARRQSLPAEQLVALVRPTSPSIHERQEEMSARSESLRWAKLQFLPDFNPMAALSGQGFEAVGGALVLPLTWRRLAGAVQEAEALLAQSRQLLLQEERDRHAQAVATARLLADTQRQAALWQDTLRSLATIAARSAEAEYRAGRAPLSAWAEAEERRLAVEQTIVELAVLEETLWARLESLAGVEALPQASDVEEESHVAS